MSAASVAEKIIAGLHLNSEARQPVADIEAEQFVLGALLTEPEALERISGIIGTADLYRHDHRLIFAAVAAVAASGTVPDIMTVKGHLDVRGELEEAGGLGYLGDLAHGCITTAGLEAWADQIAGKARRRDIAALGAVLTERAVVPGENLDVLTAHVSKALVAIMRRAQPAIAPPDVGQFLAIDFPSPEPLFGPVRCQQSVLCAAAPGVGKTHLLIGIANALLNGTDFMHWHVPKARSVLFIDGELPGSELQTRLRAYRWPRVGPEFRIVNATNWVSSCGLSHPNIADPEWQARVNEWAQGMDVIMLDNVMSLLSVPGVSMSDDTFWKPAHDFTLRQRAAGRTVIWADHLNAQGKVFGTKTKEWAVDVVFTLEKPPDHVATDGAVFTVTFTKTRGLYGKEVAPFEARLMTGPDGMPFWSYRQAEDSLREKAWEHARAGMTQRGIVAEMGISLGKVNKLLKEAREIHGG